MNNKEWLYSEYDRLTKLIKKYRKSKRKQRPYINERDRIDKRMYPPYL